MDVKYLSVVLAGLCVAGTSFANTKAVDPRLLDKDGPICSSVLCAFNDKGGFYAGVTGFYVKPSETGLGMVTDSWQFNVPGGTNAVSTPFNPDFDGAWAIKIGYDFPNSANNIEASYFQLNNKTHAINSFTNGAFSFGSVLFPDATVPLQLNPLLVSDAYLSYEVEQVDVKVGRKYSDVSGRFNIRPSVGIRYAELEHKLTFAAPGNVISEFEGTGPLFSFEANYLFGNGFGLVGYFDYALLAGEIDSHSYVFLGQNFAYTWPERDRIVNSVTGRLGLNYSHAFSSTALVTLEAGYQVSEYFNSMDTIRGWTGFAGIPNHIAGNETNSFGFQGPYASLTVHV